MTGLLVSATAGVLEAAMAQVERPSAWPDPASGFAYALLRTTQMPLPAAFGGPLRSTNPQRLRRTPELAAFGYVMARADSKTQIEWAQAFDRLMGRDIFPSDRNSFVYSPLELIGVALGVAACVAATDVQRAWLVSTIQRGFAERQFVELIAQVTAACAVNAVAPGRSNAATSSIHSVSSLQTGELAFLAALALLFPDRAAVDVDAAEREIVSRILTAAVPINDTSEAAALLVLLKRAVDREALSVSAGTDPVGKVVALCRRFQLFVDRLQARQRKREPYIVADEYDVQDMLHAILKLHFEDVRPEEWTPSYASSSSRVDFLLPRERTIVEAKMTRSGLGQKQVANELIIDITRYSKAALVDNLVCLIYDPDRRCGNPSALENDLAQIQGRLRVAAVVCPRGT
jgi:hypothetical protein